MYPNRLTKTHSFRIAPTIQMNPFTPYFDTRIQHCMRHTHPNIFFSQEHFQKSTLTTQEPSIKLLFPRKEHAKSTQHISLFRIYVVPTIYSPTSICIWCANVFVCVHRNVTQKWGRKSVSNIVALPNTLTCPARRTRFFWSKAPGWMETTGIAV